MLVNYVLPLAVTMVVVTVCLVLCTKFLKNSTEEKKLIPVKIVFWLLLVLEVAKIFYLISKNGRYEPSRYPIVFCSMVMFAYPLFCFKRNKLSSVAMSFSIIPSFIVFALFVAIQWQFKMSLIQGHSYLYHGAMLFVSIYLLTSGLYRFELKKAYPLFLALSAYIAFSTVLSLFIGGDISYFGPNSSYLGFLYDTFGYVVGNIILCMLFFALCMGVYAIIAAISNKKQAKSTSVRAEEAQTAADLEEEV